MRRARDTGLQKWLARPGLTEGKCRQMPATRDVMQRLRHGRTGPSGGDCGRGGYMHEIDHRNRCIRFGKLRGDGRKSAWSQT